MSPISNHFPLWHIFQPSSVNFWSVDFLSVFARRGTQDTQTEEQKYPRRTAAEPHPAANYHHHTTQQVQLTLPPTENTKPPENQGNNWRGVLGVNPPHEIKWENNDVEFNKRLHGSMQYTEKQQHLLKFLDFV